MWRRRASGQLRAILDHHQTQKYRKARPALQGLPLPNLDLLDLSNNLITTIPPEISSLHALELNLNNNQVIA